jgi:hypothetical protein
LTEKSLLRRLGTVLHKDLGNNFLGTYAVELQVTMSDESPFDFVIKLELR